jgi:hypothetical protein
MVQKWAITEEVPSRCANSDLAITRRNLERHVMQFKQNIIQILDARGEIIGTMNLPADIKLADLAPLKMLGAISVKVVPCAAPFDGISVGGVQ